MSDKKEIKNLHNLTKIEFKKKDVEFMEFLINNNCPFLIIFTKSDK